MATKRKLSDLVRQEFESTELSSQTSNVTDSTTVVLNHECWSLTSEATNSAAFDIQTSKLTESRSSEVPESVSDKVPRYLLLDRKEARLRADQIERLNGLTKLLNRRRRGQGERITDNTLIRVAVDLLLHRAEEVRGATEAEIQSNLRLNL
jgi:hypothetical protein